MLSFYFIYKITNFKTLVYITLSFYITGFLGLLLFHLQHTFNNSLDKDHVKNKELLKFNSDMATSSVLKIPEILKPFTNGIEYHSVHHINPGVPSYNLRKCYEELKEKNLIKYKELGIKEILISLNNTLFDEKTKKYISHYGKYS